MADAPKPAAPMFIDSGGNVTPVAPDQVSDAEQMGWVPATPKQVQDFELQQKYGSTGQAAIAGAEGAGRALTLGLSTAAERALGVSAEGVKGREEANPIASGVGTAVGIAAPLLLSGGTSALAQGAEMTAPSIIARLGAGTVKAAEGMLPAGESVLAKMALRSLEVGAGGAVEGALYGAGNVVHEAALGDPNLTAQSALAEIGLSAALGGGMGGLFGAAEVGVPAAIQKAKNAFGSAFDKFKSGVEGFYKSSAGEALTGTPSEVTTILLEHKQELGPLETLIPGVTDDLSNATPEMAKFILDNRGQFTQMEEAFPGTTRQLARTSPETARYLLDNWQKIITDPQARIKIANNLADALQQQHDAVEGALKIANKTYRKEETEHFALAEINRAAAQKAYADVVDKTSRLAQAMREKPELFPTRFARRLEDWTAGLVRDADQVATNPAKAFSALDDFKGELDKVIKFDKLPSEEALESINALKGLRTDIKNMLQSQDVWGSAGARQAAFNEAQNQYLADLKEFRKQFATKTTTKTGAVKYEVSPVKLNTYLNQMADPRGQLRSNILGRLSESSKRMINEIEETASHAPSANFDKSTVENLVNKSGDMISEARQAASVTQFKNQLDPRMSWGSMPVNPAQDLAMKGLGMVAPGFVTGTVKATVNLAQKVKSVPFAVSVLASLERAGKSISGKIDKAVGAIVRGGHAVEPFAVAEGMGAFEKRASHLGELASNPSQLQDALEQQVEHIHEHAPNTAQAMQMASARAVAFLSSKLPRPVKSGPIGPELEPSPADIAKFNRYYEAIEKPLSVLKHVQNGTITPEEIEALNVVYPELMGKIRSSIMDGLMKQKSPIPYRSRLSLSHLLGTDLDGTMSPTAILSSQIVFQRPSMKSPENQAGPQVRPTAGGAGKLGLARRMATPMQQSSQRGE